jgi:hypothetical protein
MSFRASDVFRLTADAITGFLVSLQNDNKNRKPSIRTGTSNKKQLLHTMRLKMYFKMGLEIVNLPAFTIENYWNFWDILINVPFSRF